MKLNETTRVMIDRTYIDFSNIEFGIIDFDETHAKIQLTQKGLEDYKTSVKTRVHKHGTDEHLINLVVDELGGQLWFDKEEEYLSDAREDVYAQIVQNLFEYLMKNKDKSLRQAIRGG